MRHFAYIATTALLSFATVIPAAAQPAKATKQTEILRHGLKAMAAATNSSGQSKRLRDPDQGDDKASDRAMLVVCTKDTPAAKRSAICDGEPVSPN